MKILYEDNHLLGVEKPINVPVQADASKDPDLLSLLKAYLIEKYNKPGQAYLGLVHRLDRPVGGAMVFAKTSKAASRLSRDLQNHSIQRQYLAIVNGRVKVPQDTLIHYLQKNNQTNITSVVGKNQPQAKKAILHYHKIAEHDNYSLLNVKLETGRSHQIRVQMAAIGHPLFGDQKYGQAINKVGQQLALWAHQLEFNHPTKKEPITLISKPPQHGLWNFFEYKDI